MHIQVGCHLMPSHAVLNENVKSRLIPGIPAIVSQQPLPSKLDLGSQLSLPISTLTRTDSDALRELDLVFYVRKGARAMVWKVYAGEGAGTEVVRAVGWDHYVSS